MQSKNRNNQCEIADKSDCPGQSLILVFGVVDIQEHPEAIHTVGVIGVQGFGLFQGLWLLVDAHYVQVFVDFEVFVHYVDIGWTPADEGLLHDRHGNREC